MTQPSTTPSSTQTGPDGPASKTRYRSAFRPGLFEGQTVIVTGGGSGLGRCAAHELSSNSCLTILYNHLSTDATSQSFAYLPNDSAVFVELRSTLVRGLPMVMLDIDFQNRCVCGCVSETQVTPQPCELDASDTEIEAHSTYALAARPKFLRIKSLMSSMLRPKSNMGSKNPIVDLSSLE